MTHYAALALFPLLMAYSALSDLFTMTISNKISLALIVGFLALAFASGMPLASIGWHLGCGAAVLVVTFGMFAMGWIGGGDAKLAAATAVWIGFPELLPYLAVAAVFGGVLTLILLQARVFPLPAFMARHAWIARLHDRKTGIPYGIALAAAGLMLYPETQIWRLAVSA